LLDWLRDDARAEIYAGVRLATRAGFGGVAVLRFTEDVDVWLDQARARSPHPEWLEGELAPISERGQRALSHAIADDDEAQEEAGIDSLGIENVDDGVRVSAYAPDEHAAQAWLTERYGPHVHLTYLGTTRPPGSGKFGPW
jgi:hypothetical protein